MKALSLFLLAILWAAPALAHPGVGIVMDARENVFFTDLTHVWKIAKDGKKTIAVHNVHTHELFLDSAGNLFGEHLWYEGDATKKWGHRIWRLASDGSLSDVIPAREGFRTGYSFVRDSAGNMYWSEGETSAKIDGGGRVRVVAKSRLPWSPTGGFFAPTGDLWLLEYSITNAVRVRRIARDGRITVY